MRIQPLLALAAVFILPGPFAEGRAGPARAGKPSGAWRLHRRRAAP